jgi:hypothetical protein
VAYADLYTVTSVSNSWSWLVSSDLQQLSLTKVLQGVGAVAQHSFSGQVNDERCSVEFKSAEFCVQLVPQLYMICGKYLNVDRYHDFKGMACRILKV